MYSVGINDETSFDEEFVRRWPWCKLFAFDPSIGRETGDTFMGRGISFYNIGLGTRSSVVKNGGVVWNMKSLDGIMDMLGHDHVDVLKVDIEGWEWAVFEEWAGELKFTQLLAELHFWPERKQEDDEKKVALLGVLERAAWRFSVTEKTRNGLGQFGLAWETGSWRWLTSGWRSGGGKGGERTVHFLALCPMPAFLWRLGVVHSASKVLGQRCMPSVCVCVGANRSL